MNNAIFTTPGGFPADQNTLGFMQDSYSSLQKLCFAIVGDANGIVSGCAITGGNTAAGVLIIAGELIPFDGGPTGIKISIVEDVENAVYQDLVSKPVYKRRKAVWSVVGLDWSTFVRVTPLVTVVPKNGIIMWSGLIVNIPAGWYLCDGSNGTPNLSGKFIVGFDATDTDYNAPGKIGGAKSVKLTAAQSGLPVHSHGVTDPGHNHSYIDTVTPNTGTGYAGGGFRQINAEEEIVKTTANKYTGLSVNAAIAQDAAQFHENRPPYYTLAFIMRA